MFENVDGRTTDGRTTDAGVTGILIVHLRAFGSGELTMGAIMWRSESIKCKFPYFRHRKKYKHNRCRNTFSWLIR